MEMEARIQTWISAQYPFALPAQPPLSPAHGHRCSTDTTDSASLASSDQDHAMISACAVRADSPLLGFDLPSSSQDPLHYPSPDYTRELPLEHEYTDASDKHSRGLDPVHELDFDQDLDFDAVPRPHQQSRSRSHSVASSTYLNFPPVPPSSRRASRLPSFSSTLDSPQPLPPAVIPALRERVSALSLHKQTSARSLRRTTTDSTLSLLSSHSPSLAGIRTPDSVRNAVYFDSDHLGSLLLAAAPPSPSTPSPSSPYLSSSYPYTPHSHGTSSSQVYIGSARPSSTGSQVYLGPPSSTPTSPTRTHTRTFPSRSSDESAEGFGETETPGTSPASASFDCASPTQSRLSWADDTELAHPAPRVYLNTSQEAHEGEYDGEDDAEFGCAYDAHDGDHTYTYGQERSTSAGLAPPQSSRWSLGSSIDAAALEKQQQKEKRESWGRRRSGSRSPGKSRKRDSSSGGKSKSASTSGKAEKKMGRRKRLVSFISARFSAAPSASTIALPLDMDKRRLDMAKDSPLPVLFPAPAPSPAPVPIPMPLLDKELPPIVHSSPSPSPPLPPPHDQPETETTAQIQPQTQTHTRPALPALTIPAPSVYTAVVASQSPTTSTAQMTPTTATSGRFSSVSDASGDSGGEVSPLVAAPFGPVEEDRLVVTVTAPDSTVEAEGREETQPQEGLLSPTSIKTLMAPTPAPAPGSPTFTAPAPGSPTFTTPAPAPAPERVFTAPPPAPTPTPPPTFTPPVTYTYTYPDPPSPGFDPFRAASPAGLAPVQVQVQVRDEAQAQAQAQAQTQTQHLSLSQIQTQTQQAQVQNFSLSQTRIQQTQTQVQKKRSRRSLGIRGLAVRMGLASSSVLEVYEAYPPSPSPSPSPFSSASTSASASVPVPTSPGSPRKKKGPKRKLVISGIEEGGYEAVREWCEGFGEVKEMRRIGSSAGGVGDEKEVEGKGQGKGKGSLVVDFRKASVAETVCRVQAQVYIRGAGSVSLSWCTKSKTKTGSRIGGV